MTINNKYLKIGGIVGGVFLLLAIGVGIYFFVFRSRPTVAGAATLSPTDPTASNQLDQAKILEEIGKLIELPTDEEPTIAAISDITKLSGQPFFQKAQNADIVLIYTKAKKAFIYNPTLKKIINVDTVSLDTPTPIPPTPEPVVPTSTIAPILPTNPPLPSPSPASPQ